MFYVMMLSHANLVSGSANITTIKFLSGRYLETERLAAKFFTLLPVLFFNLFYDFTFGKFHLEGDELSKAITEGSSAFVSGFSYNQAVFL
jgi:hypothetical protein